MIRHRSRLMLAAAMCLALSASVSATATEYTAGPSWKAPAAQSAPTMPVMVAELPRIAPASMAVSPGEVVACVGLGAVMAFGVVKTSRPREKPRLWA